MKRFPLYALLPLLLVAGACGHTNKLAQYNLSGRTALFRTTIAGDAASSIAVIQPPNDNTTVGVIAAIGSVVVGIDGQKKLSRAINSDTISRSISLGVREATADYLSLKSVGEISDNPEVLVETELTDCKLVSASAGLVISVNGKSRLIDRRTGTVVWENSESHTVPVSQTYLAAIAPRAISSGFSIFNAVQLLTLTEDEIRAIVNMAAKDAGREIGETLREDVADLHK